MKRLLASFLVLLGLLGAAPSFAQAPPTQIVLLGNNVPNCGPANAFLARTSGLDQKHVNAYKKLICGLVTAGIWSTLDYLNVYATSTNTIALLNLVSTSYSPATANGGPTFTTDVGYTGVDASATVSIDTGFNPSTASTPQYTLNAAHFSLWNNSNITSTHYPMGAGDASQQSRIYPKFTTDSKDYFRVNELNTGASGGASAVGDARGMFMAVRTDASTEYGYLNGVDQALVGTAASGSKINSDFFTLSSGTLGAANQICMASIGGPRTQAQATTFYNLMHAYLVTIAGIAY